MPCSLCKELGISSTGHNKVTHHKFMKANSDPVEEIKFLFAPELSKSPSKAADGLRGALPTSELIWSYRDDLDAYSNSSKDVVCKLNPERDHVFEIQLLDAAFFQYSSVVTQMVTRGEKLRIMNIANNVKNLNITSRGINQSKKGPFTLARNELIAEEFDSSKCHGIDSFVYDTHGTRVSDRYRGFKTSDWENIKKEVVKSYDVLAEEIPNAIGNESRAESFRDCLHEVFMSLKIEESNFV